MSFQTPITISNAIEDIDNNRLLLPAIQREFVWSNTKIERLFDSIMRNYPISSFLFWKVEGDAKNQYKYYGFLKNYRERYQTHNEEYDTSGVNDFMAVLDGQQRLAALYIGTKDFPGGPPWRVYLEGANLIDAKVITEIETEIK